MQRETRTYVTLQARWPHRTIMLKQRAARLKKSKDSPGRRSPGGRSFYSRGPVAEKLLSPSLLCVRGTNSFRMSLGLDRSGRRPTSDIRQQSSARYAGAAPPSDWCTSPAILNTTRRRTGSQCSCRNTGVIWSQGRAPVTRRWRRWSSPSLMPYSSELQ